MNSGDIVSLTVLVTLTLTTGAVLILRPLSKRLGALLEVMTQQKLRASNADPNDTHRIRELLVSIDSRLNVLEERQDFAEALISAGDTKLLAMTAAQQAQERN
ncbi:hypothetical protein [Longimicrobium sp.]|uniref:hypothetical protein n=1 Tax=Longimicrobium sp. TaxID=2029185 RepID=UPI002C205DE8|nr:hypothetical protein [Longimicrobium sp.]HSU17013.1 hypothetical protein [Longimicrobium sp.]